MHVIGPSEIHEEIYGQIEYGFQRSKRMDSSVKIIAAYLPQFHQIPENDKWWGEGYTDWVGVKKAKPLFKGHVQPNVPLNHHYYSLDNPEEIYHQIELANEEGNYGFSIYHYWFNSNLQLLQKPAEIILSHSDWPIHYMFNWDNGSWKRTWSAIKDANDMAPEADTFEKRPNDNGLLAELKYGKACDWKIHFDYLLKFFRDPRYIKINGKPVFGFYNPANDPDTLKEMVQYWDALAIENGFPGIHVIAKNNHGENTITPFSFRYEPPYSGWENRTVIDKAINKTKTWAGKRSGRPVTYEFNRIWEKILENAIKCKDANTIYGATVGYDDTPRRAGGGKVIINRDSEKFCEYLTKLIKICIDQGKEYIFLTAWNEWGEGAFLEPDEDNEYAYLSAVRKAVKGENSY